MEHVDDFETLAAATGGPGYSREGVASAQAALRSNLRVKFTYEAVEDVAKSKEHGRPYYVNAEVVTISTPGDNTNIIVKQVTDRERKMYAPQYAAFLDQRRLKAAEGTPVDVLQLTALTPADVANYKACNVRTVEQLSAMSDAETDRFVGGKGHRDKAREYLAFARAEAPKAAMQEAINKRDARIAALEAQLRDLEEKLTKPAVAKK